MRLFIFGPMSGYPLRNRQLFDQAVSAVQAAGDEPVSPFDLEDVSEESPEFVQWCIQALLASDGGVVLPGWRQDPTSVLLGAIATVTGNPVYAFPDLTTPAPPGRFAIK